MVLNLVNMSTMLSATSQESYFLMVAYMFIVNISMNPNAVLSGGTWELFCPLDIMDH